jgi:hypothetical protein
MIELVKRYGKLHIDLSDFYKNTIYVHDNMYSYMSISDSGIKLGYVSSRKIDTRSRKLIIEPECDNI